MSFKMLVKTSQFLKKIKKTRHDTEIIILKKRRKKQAKSLFRINFKMVYFSASNSFQLYDNVFILHILNRIRFYINVRACINYMNAKARCGV